MNSDAFKRARRYFSYFYKVELKLSVVTELSWRFLLTSVMITLKGIKTSLVWQIVPAQDPAQAVILK